MLASTQRAFALSSLPQKSGMPAWKTIPSFYLVGTIDRVIPPFAQLLMAQRANATIVQVRGSHLVMISHPEAVTDLIQRVAQTVTANSNINSEPTSTNQSLADLSKPFRGEKVPTRAHICQIVGRCDRPEFFRTTLQVGEDTIGTAYADLFAVTPLNDRL